MRLRLLVLIPLMYVTAAIAAPQTPTSIATKPTTHQPATTLSKVVASTPAPVQDHTTFDPAHPAYTVDETPEKGFWDRLFEDPNSFLVMVFTFVLGVAALVQGYILFSQDRKLRESLDATREANRTAKDSAQRQLRAYLSLESNSSDGIGISVSEEKYLYNGKPRQKMQFTVDLKIINRGITPAYDVQYEMSYYWFVENSKDYTIEIRRVFVNPRDYNCQNFGVLNMEVPAPVKFSREFECEYANAIELTFFGRTSASSNPVPAEYSFEKSFEECQETFLMFEFKVKYCDAFERPQNILSRYLYDHRDGTVVLYKGVEST